MGINITNTREHALRWWRYKTEDQKRESIELFKTNNPKYRDWDWKLISLSSNMVELVYKSIVTCGSR